MKKYLFLLGLAVILTGCTLKLPGGESSSPTEEGESAEIIGETGKICPEEVVKVPNIGGTGRRLANCFVEYPPVAKRDDNSYYINEEICGQFTQDFMENITGRKIVRLVDPDRMNLFQCRYYFNDKDHLDLTLEYEDINADKNMFIPMAQRTESSPLIPKDNLVLWKTQKNIMMIYYFLSDYKYLRLEVLPVNIMTSDEVMNLAVRLGSVIKDYK